MAVQSGLYDATFGSNTDWKSVDREQLKAQLGGNFASAALVTDAVRSRGEHKLYWVAAAASSSTTNIHAAVTCPTSGTTTVTTAITNPDVPRVVNILGNQATVTGNVVITGTDISNAAITETIASNGTSTVAGVKAFKTITSIVIPTRGAASDSIALGGGPAVGLPDTLLHNTVMVAWVNEAAESTQPTVTTSATVLSQNTFTTSTAMAGHAVGVSYIAEYAAV